MTPDQTPFKDYFAKHARKVTEQGRQTIMLGGEVYKTTHDNGVEEWFRDGQRRLVKYPDGGVFWCKDGKYRRGFYPAAGEQVDWFADGSRRCKYPDGRAYYYDKDDFLHRTDGPAVIQSAQHKEFWLRGKMLTAQEFNAQAPAFEAEKETKKIESGIAAMQQGTRQPVKAMKTIKISAKAAPSAQ